MPIAQANTTAPLAGAVTPAEWSTLSGKAIFFGHQSVGRNILEGIDSLLAENPQAGLKVIRTDNPAGVAGPAFVEAGVGENGDPASKDAEFAAMLDAGAARPGGVALYKYCFLDITASTDVKARFEAYRANVEEIRRKHPGLVLVHVTVPLTTVESGPEAWLRETMGRASRRASNVKRNEYNEMLLREYQGKEPVFDLAALQSTLPDGSRAYFERNGKQVFVLAEEWTYDGGHLNAAGSKMAANQLLRLLASL